MQHAHPQGLYAANCRACRMNVQLDHIRASAYGPSVSAKSASRTSSEYAVARELVGRHVWTSGQRRALRLAATLGVNTADLSAWVEAASKEVSGDRS